jgi:hypothetical protein
MSGRDIWSWPRCGAPISASGRANNATQREGEGRYDRCPGTPISRDLSEKEAWRRIENRNTDLKSSLFIARNTFEVLKSRFEPLGSDERCIEIAG